MFVGALLWVAIVAMLGGVAEAQGMASANDAQGAKRNADAITPETEGTTRMVIKPGDSLWSISQERLRSDATPRQVANEVDRIHMLNRSRIGGDSDLIFPGQEILLPPIADRTDEPVVSESASSPASKQIAAPATTEPATTEPAKTEPAKTEPARQAAMPTPEPVTLPAFPAGKAVPAVGLLPSGEQRPTSPVTSFAKAARSVVSTAPSATLGLFSGIYEDNRRLLSLGVLVLTFGVALLMIWKLPMKREVEAPFAARRMRGEHFSGTPTNRGDGSDSTSGSLEHARSPGDHWDGGTEAAPELDYPRPGVSPPAEMPAEALLEALPGELRALQLVIEEQSRRLVALEENRELHRKPEVSPSWRDGLQVPWVAPLPAAGKGPQIKPRAGTSHPEREEAKRW
jgi:LysM repeat protein